MRLKYFVSWLLIFPLLAALIALSPAPVSAQSFYGSVVGAVTDNSGAVIPNARVTLTNLGTNEKRVATSDSAGNFRFVSLVPANYRVEVEMANFKRFLRTPIVVQVDNTARVDAVLEVGSVTETTEVTTAPPMLQTESGSLGDTVEGRQVQEMPLNGRNTLNLIALVPGVVPQGTTGGSAAMNRGSGTSSAAWGNYQIGGGLPLQSAMYIDGAPISIMNKNFTVLVPVQDVIQEFKVESSGVSAEFGRFGGGVVNMTTKSGSNSFHGTAYEYIRNNIVNANTFFGKTTGAARPQWNQNQYGGAVGGPIWKDKAFFYFAWEEIHIRTGQFTQTNVPTDALQAGVFAKQITDPKGICDIQPYTGQTINGKTFPSGGWYIANLYGPGLKSGTTCGDQTAKVFATFYPGPNNPTNTSQNYATTVSQGDDGHQVTGRVDYNLTTNNRFFTRFTLWPLVDSIPNVMGNANGWKSGGSQTHNHTNQIVVGDTYTFNPSTLLDIRADYIRQYGDAIPPAFGNVDYTKFGPNYVTLASSMTYQNLPSWSFSGPLHNLFNFSYNNLTRTFYNNYHLSGSLTKIAGKHTLKFGAEGRLIQRDDIGSDQAASGHFNISSTLSGDEWANMLMGYFDKGTITTVKATTSFNYYKGFYLQDTWQAAPKLTLNFGIRWELPGAIAEGHDNLTVLLPDVTDPNIGIPGTVGLVASDQYKERTTFVTHNNLLGPRFGFAYRVSDNTVLRGGYALSYLPPDGQIGAYANASVINSASTVNTMTATSVAGATFSISNPFPGGVTPATGRSNAAFVKNYIGQPVSAAYPFQPYPHSQSMNLSIGRQMKGDLLIDIGVAHTLGTHLPSLSDGRNQVKDSDIEKWGSTLSATTCPVGATTCTPGTPISLTYYGVKLPNSLQVFGQTLRPFPQFSNFSNTTDYHGTSSYNALQVKVQKRFKTAGQIGGAYTWMKLIGDADTILPGLELKSGGSGGSGQGLIQDYYNRKAERSIYSFNVPHRAIINYVLNLPFGQGQRFGSGAHGAAGKIISGWSVNGITTFQTGFPLYLNTSGNNLSKTFGAGTIRPNYVPGCTKTNPASAFDRAAPGAQKWFNTACFTLPISPTDHSVVGTNAQGVAAYAFGNEPRVDGTLKSHGISNFDFSVVKSTILHEQTALQFRVEFFNIFNHTQFAPPVTQTDSSQFGMVLNQANQPRLIQGALRLNF